jgi:hypothetical protein
MFLQARDNENLKFWVFVFMSLCMCFLIASGIGNSMLEVPDAN